MPPSLPPPPKQCEASGTTGGPMINRDFVCLTVCMCVWSFGVCFPSLCVCAFPSVCLSDVRRGWCLLVQCYGCD